jgi:hypothetical protein
MSSDNNNPLAEVFGFPIENETDRAKRYRQERLCPFNNVVPNCTKDKAENPLGVCSINNTANPVITCPIRFREDWIITSYAAKFLFPPDTKWTSLGEIKLLDRNGTSAGNIDYVLVSYDDKGRVTNFGSLEVQGVYISGNLRKSFEAYMSHPSKNFAWKKGLLYPKPDFLSSSRKRLIPQMLFKGGILKSWNKKQTVALQKDFFETLPSLPTVTPDKADIAWFLYDFKYNKLTTQYNLVLDSVVYTEFTPALHKVITPEPGQITDFVDLLQSKLAKKLSPPDAPTLLDTISE